MEPIACCVEAFGLITGYIFWLTTHRGMELEDVAENYANNRTLKTYSKYGFNIEEYNELKNIQTYLMKKKNVLSDNIEHVLEALNYN